MLPAPLVALVLTSHLSPIVTTFSTPAMALRDGPLQLTADGKHATDGHTWIDLATESPVPSPVPDDGNSRTILLPTGQFVTLGPKELRLYDGKRVRTLPHESGSHWDTYTPDPSGKLVARPSMENSRPVVQVAEWPAEGKQAVWRTVAGPGESGGSLVFNRTGSHLAWLGQGEKRRSRITVHDLAAGTTVHLVPDEQGLIIGPYTVSPDGKTAVVVSARATIFLFDTSDGECTRVLPHRIGWSDGPVHVKYTPDSRSILVSGVENNRVIVVPTTPKGELRQLAVGDGDGVGVFDITADSKKMVAADGAGVVRVYDLATGKRLDRGQHDTWVGVSWAGESRAASWSHRGRVVVWDTRTGNIERDWAIGQPGDNSLDFERITLSPDGKYVAAEELVVGGAGRFRVFETATAKVVIDFQKRHIATGWTFHPDGLTIGVSTERTHGRENEEGKQFRLFSLADGREVRKFPIDFNGRLQFSTDGRAVYLLSGSNSVANATCHELATGGIRWGWLRKFADHPGFRRRTDALLADDPTVRLVYALGANGLDALDPLTGKADWSLPLLPSNGEYPSFSASADGRWLVANVSLQGEDEQYQHGFGVWDLRARSQRPSFTSPPVDDIHAVAISADGSRVISLTAEGEQRVWDLKKLHRLTEYPLANLWEQLKAESKEAAVAMAALVSDPERAVKLLTEMIQPTAEPNADDVKRWLGELSSPDFRTRQEAERQLGRVADVARKRILATAENPPNAEAGERLDRLVKRIDGFEREAESLRVLRAVEVVERLRTPAAVKLLERWAGGAPDALLTTEAKASLTRVKK